MMRERDEIDALVERMERATQKFCVTRVPTGETGKYPPAPPCSRTLDECDEKMEEATVAFLKQSRAPRSPRTSGL